MTKSAFEFLLSLVLMLSLSQFVLSQSGPPTQFSADLVMTRPLQEAVQGRIYFGGSRWRFDVSSQSRAGIMIFDMEQRIAYVLMPQVKMYMEVRSDAPGSSPLTMPDIRPVDPANPCAGGRFTACRELGPDLVEGRTCDNWEYTSSGVTRVACLDRRIHVYIRATGSNGSKMEMHHVTEATQPDGLFHVPPGYQKIEPTRPR